MYCWIDVCNSDVTDDETIADVYVGCDDVENDDNAFSNDSSRSCSSSTVTTTFASAVEADRLVNADVHMHNCKHKR
jgi:hypothetical protein